MQLVMNRLDPLGLFQQFVSVRPSDLLPKTDLRLALHYWEPFRIPVMVGRVAQ